MFKGKVVRKSVESSEKCIYFGMGRTPRGHMRNEE
jgi:hypothetical protein